MTNQTMLAGNKHVHLTNGKTLAEELDRINMLDHLEKGDQWDETRMTFAQYGQMQYENAGCKTCHSLDGSQGQGPSFKGLFGRVENLSDGSTVTVDENYIRESIEYPNAKVVQGYSPVMPSYQGTLNDEKINAIIEFIKEQK